MVPTPERPTHASGEPEPVSDPVASAFENLRSAAKKRGVAVPDLGQQGRSPVPRRTPRKRPSSGGFGATGASASGGNLPFRGRGRPTGPDGRHVRRRIDVEAFGSLLGREIEKRGWEHDIASGWVHNHWDELVGEKIAQHTSVEMIKDKTLFITCDSTAWATNLRMMQRQILQIIAERVGPDIIAELKIFGPKAPSWRKGPLHVKGRGPRDTYG